MTSPETLDGSDGDSPHVDVERCWRAFSLAAAIPPSAMAGGIASLKTGVERPDGVERPECDTPLGLLPRGGRHTLSLSFSFSLSLCVGRLPALGADCLAAASARATLRSAAKSFLAASVPCASSAIRACFACLRASESVDR